MSCDIGFFVIPAPFGYAAFPQMLPQRARDTGRAPNFGDGKEKEFVMELTEVQLFMIGTVASVIVWIVKFVRAKGGSIHAGWLTAGVYVVSGILAWFFAPLVLPALPPFVDLASFVPAFLQWIADLLIPLSTFVGFATLVYNVLLKQVLDAAGVRFRAWRTRG